MRKNVIAAIYYIRARGDLPHLSVFHDGHAVTALNVLCGVLTSGEEHGCHDVCGMCVKSTDRSCTSLLIFVMSGDKKGYVCRGQFCSIGRLIQVRPYQF